MIGYCVRCKQLRRQLQQQKIANLPKDRMCTEPPFTYCGVDIFGPFVVKDDRKEVKKYDALHTCLSSRATHIEVVHSLSTDSFILSLRCFIGRRGIVRMIRSDNGANFVGASAELIRTFQEMDHKKIGDFLEENGGDWMVWKRNPPHASNMGGVWERQIRSVRSILNSLLKTHGSNMTEESLQTLVVEVKAIVNSKPLPTDVMNDATSLAPLSPVNLLTMKSRVVMPPPGNFTTPDRYSKKQWRRMQYVANEFWDRWRKEVLLTLQNREKWNNQKQNCQVGDIVLLRQEADRNRWPMARSVNVYSDRKGNVCSVRLLLGASDKSDNSSRYLGRPVNKLVLLVENNN